MEEIIIAFHPFGKAVRMKTNDDEIIFLIHHLYKNFIIEEDELQTDTNELLLNNCGTGQDYEVFRNGIKIQHARDKLEIITGLNEFIIHQHLNVGDNHWAVHAGVIEVKGNAFLFVAQTGSGKSTLTAFLTLKGYGYLSDDIGIIQCDDFSVIPCPTSMKLRDGVVQKYPEFESIQKTNVFILGRGIKRWIYEPEVPAGWRKKRSPLKGVICFSYKENGVTLFRPMPKLLAVKQLLLNSFDPGTMDKNRLMATRITKELPVYRMEYGDFNNLYEKLEIFFHGEKEQLRETG
jgi:hypothetical protein